jgi:hypothetical protein
MQPDMDRAKAVLQSENYCNYCNHSEINSTINYNII